MNLQGKTILVTGGAGAIGSNLVNKLLEEKAHVIVLDDLSSGRKDNLQENENLEFLEGSINDNALMEKAFEKEIDIIFHLAALFANQNSVDHPQKDLEVNGFGTLALLEKAQKQGVGRFVFTSSSCVYGNKENVLVEEELDLRPETPYAISKLLGEKYVNFFNDHYGMDTVILRLFNSYGPGEMPGKYRNVIPNFMQLAISGQELPITGNGKETRDFTFVGDTVNGMLSAGVKPKANGNTINLGAGRETTIQELAEKINNVTGNEKGIVYKPRRDWDHITKRVASIGKAEKILGYQPAVLLDEGLKITYNWFIDRGIK